MHSTTTVPPPTMPGSLPLIGHMLKMARRPLKFVESLRDEGDVVVFRLGMKPAYMVNQPELIKELLITQYGKFEKGGPLFEQAAKLIGNGLVASNGSFHRRQRRLSQPAFHHGRMASYASAAVEVVENLSEEWHDGDIVDISHDFYNMTMNVLTKTLFSALPPETAAEIRRALPVLVTGVGRRAFLPIEFIHKLPLPIKRREEAALQRWYNLVDGIIAEYRASGADRGDLLSMLMLARDEETGEGMTDHQLHDEIRSMMVAGTETSATALLWAFHVFSTRPDIERRVHVEVDSVLDGRTVSYDILPELKYLGRVVQEILRLYPTGWILTRRAVTDVDLGGYHIPEGADVFFSPYAVHQDPAYYTEPKFFDPDRWLPERARSISRSSYLPFGAGARKCIGESFAYVEMMIALATLTSRWVLRSASKHPVRPVAGSTYKPSDSHMHLSARRAGRA
ncbi:MAG TPA: cytochrome P450 [Amycolatopsis sp.]|uniref:cytochrome P450 n=1 Tax=Amycolatopsis sp. TaxID=37632 RepID=UPI002B46BF91|nr:cytochrome P450 [Amycolatopsis sp.]HKS48358.1 cytochrome P450 [Amycolatopsis sp.]